ncbi:MAG: hypothetical protein KAJ13_08990 [Gemmatimonadetes bacterium]|nr:hypothetical protein [Gemmatimonadota bacterium]
MSALGQSDVLPLRSVLLKHAQDAFGDQPTLDATWEELGYMARPDFAGAVTEYEAFQELLERLGAEIHLAPADSDTGPDSVYVRDAAVICDCGAILCNMGKPARETEPSAAERSLRAAGVPIVGRITGSGRMEGGDVAWINDRNVAVGLGYRTNAEGIRQLRSLLGSEVDRVVPVPLPHWHGPGDVFHLMSMFSPVDRDLAVVYSRLLPVPFRQLLLKHGCELVEVPDEEFESMGCNVLAVGPRRCVALEGNPMTRQRLEAAGAEVHTYRGREISTKGGGGPTCLTRPLVRSE